jgi:hypothetical protein
MQRFLRRFPVAHASQQIGYGRNKASAVIFGVRLDNDCVSQAIQESFLSSSMERKDCFKCPDNNPTLLHQFPPRG